MSISIETVKQHSAMHVKIKLQTVFRRAVNSPCFPQVPGLLDLNVPSLFLQQHKQRQTLTSCSRRQYAAEQQHILRTTWLHKRCERTACLQHSHIRIFLPGERLWRQSLGRRRLEVADDWMPACSALDLLRLWWWARGSIVSCAMSGLDDGTNLDSLPLQSWHFEDPGLFVRLIRFGG